jgi:hypothetical protein
MKTGYVIVKCERCKKEFEARITDRNRGWGKFCSKSCKAIKQEARTGQYAEYLQKSKDNQEDVDYEGDGWDAHKDIW